MPGRATVAIRAARLGAGIGHVKYPLRRRARFFTACRSISGHSSPQALLLGDVAEEALASRGQDRTGRDRVHGDPGAGQILREADRRVEHRRLRRGVKNQQGTAQQIVTLRDERQGRDTRYLCADVDDAGCLASRRGRTLRNKKKHISVRGQRPQPAGKLV